LLHAPSDGLEFAAIYLRDLGPLIGELKAPLPVTDQTDQACFRLLSWRQQATYRLRT